MKNICFVAEAIYPNYINRLKNNNLKKYLELNIDIPYYISTNDVESFNEYSNYNNIKVFDIDKIREYNTNTLINESLPKKPILYSEFPWNIKRFIMRKAAEDGFNIIMYSDCDTNLKEEYNTQKIKDWVSLNYFENCIKTSASIYEYKYRNTHTKHVFFNHKKYIKDLKISSNKYLDTFDGPNIIFISKSKEDMLYFLDTWDFVTYYGYEKNYGYRNKFLSNLSIVKALCKWDLDFVETPFETNHYVEDRYI